MDSKTIRETALAYLSVYDQDLREEMEYNGVIGESDGMYDQVISHLIGEGYADSYESAELMIDTMSEEWIDDIVETIISRGNIPAHLRGTSQADVRKDAENARARQVAAAAGQKGYGDEEKFKSDWKLRVTPSSTLKRKNGTPETVSDRMNREKPYAKRMTGELAREYGSRAAERVTRVRKGKGEPQAVTLPRKQNESYDLYDVVLGHLIDEGYAYTYESAEAIMVNMSEEWIDSIVEASSNDDRIRRNITRFGYTPPSNWDPSANRGRGATVSPKQAEKRRRKSLRPQ
jgi:hypothetical protein